MNLSAYPEHAKLAETSEIDRHAIGRFLEWLLGNGWFICEMDSRGKFIPSIETQNVEPLIAAYYDLDLIAFDQERQTMLNEIEAVKELNEIRQRLKLSKFST